MRKLDKRGVAALEFCLVAVPLFTLMFVIFDLGRYAITMQSLRMLANAGARETMIICYTNEVIYGKLLTDCVTGDPLNLLTSRITCVAGTCDPLPTDAAKQAVAPFLYAGGLTPKLNIPTPAQGVLTVTASEPKFTMLVPIWGTALNAPSASTSVPF